MLFLAVLLAPAAHALDPRLGVTAQPVLNAAADQHFSFVMGHRPCTEHGAESHELRVAGTVSAD